MVLVRVSVIACHFLVVSLSKIFWQAYLILWLWKDKKASTLNINTVVKDQ